MVITVKKDDEKLLEIINALSKFNSVPYEVSSDNDEYNSTFINSLLTSKDECEKNIKNNSILISHTNEELYKDLYEI